MRYQEMEQKRPLRRSAAAFALLLCLSLLCPADGGALACAWVSLVLAAAVCVWQRALFCGARRELTGRAPGRDALAVLAAALPLLYGLADTVRLTCEYIETGAAQPGEGPSFAAAAGVLVLTAADRAREAALRARLEAPLCGPPRPTAGTEVCLLRDDAQNIVPLAEVRPGDLLLVRPGETVPADGIVCLGVSAVDESALTGAGEPVDKFPGSPVLAATRNRDGALTCRVARLGADTTAARAENLLRQAAATRPALAGRMNRLARLERWFAPAAALLAAAVLLLWLLLGRSLGFALARAAAVLAVSCPGLAALAVSSAVLAGCGRGARSGILFRDAAAMEAAAALDTVLLDKDGTITTGDPEVVEIIGTRKVPAKFLLGMAAGLELHSGHPLARAILKKAEEEKIAYSRLTAFEEEPGRGLRGKLAGKVLAGGSRDFIAAQCEELPPDLVEAASRLEQQGITPLWFSLAGHAAGIIGVSDVVKSTSKPAVEQMRALGLDVLLLTGDSPANAAHIAGLVGLDQDHLRAEVPAGGNAAEVRRLQPAARVAMTGDGRADAEAMRAAALGVAMDGAGDLPEAAGLLLLRRELADLPAAVRLARRVMEVMRRSLLGAAVFQAAALLAAAGLLAPLGFTPGPVLGALAACLAGAAVQAAALRLETFAMQGDSPAAPLRPGAAETDEGGPI